MALYINGRPVNPIVTFLASAVVIAGIIGLGILLLPVIGGLFVIALLIVAGAYCRWRYGDPFAQMQKQAEEMLRRRARPQEEQPQQQTVQDEPDLKAGTARTGIKRVTVVEDAVVVEEIRHKDL